MMTVSIMSLKTDSRSALLLLRSVNEFRLRFPVVMTLDLFLIRAEKTKLIRDQPSLSAMLHEIRPLISSLPPRFQKASGPLTFNLDHDLDCHAGESAQSSQVCVSIGQGWASGAVSGFHANFCSKILN